jgi:hypothetical protein
MDKELDELISKYTEDLINLRNKWKDLGITPPEETSDESKDITPVTESPPTEVEQEDSKNDNGDETETADTKKESPAVADDIPEADPENFSYFSAAVYSGNQAYAIPDAKISIYIDGKLHAFLITDENGKTKKIKLGSYPKINTFIPESQEQRVDYYADIYADGFTPKKGLLVSAVGGSDILLNAELTPLSERID